MPNYYGLDPAVKKLLDNYRNQISYFNEIHKNRLNEVISIAKQVKHVPSYNSAVINAALNTTSFLNIDEYMQFKNGVLNTKKILDSANFQRNLFSEKAIKSFKDIYRFDDDVVSQAQQTIRDFYVNPTAISTLTETINSTYPINNQNADNRYNKFINAFKNDYPHPFKTVVRWSSSIGASTDIENFATNYINDNDLHIQNSLILAIVCLISFLSTYYSYFKKWAVVDE